MSKTRIFLTRSKDVAAQTAGFWVTMHGNTAVEAFGPTDDVQIREADSDDLLWEAPSAGPWYGIVVPD